MGYKHGSIGSRQGAGLAANSRTFRNGKQALNCRPTYTGAVITVYRMHILLIDRLYSQDHYSNCAVHNIESLSLLVNYVHCFETCGTNNMPVETLTVTRVGFRSRCVLPMFCIHFHSSLSCAIFDILIYNEPISIDIGIL